MYCMAYIHTYIHIYIHTYIYIYMVIIYIYMAEAATAGGSTEELKQTTQQYIDE